MYLNITADDDYGMCVSSSSCLPLSALSANQSDNSINKCGFCPSNYVPDINNVW